MFRIHVFETLEGRTSIMYHSRPRKTSNVFGDGHGSLGIVLVLRQRLDLVARDRGDATSASKRETTTGPAVGPYRSLPRWRENKSFTF